MVNDVAQQLFGDAHELTPVVNASLANAGRIYEGDWRGRVALWVLSKTLDVMYPVPTEQVPPEEAVFPLSLAGAGFDEWRRSFERIWPALRTVRFQWNRYEQDLRAFAARLPDPRQADGFLTGSLRIAGQMYAQVDAIRRLLGDIDVQKALQTRYSFRNRVHTGWLLVFSVLAFVSGIVIPLLLLVWSPRESFFGATFLGIRALGFTIAACVVFALDVATAPFVPQQRLLRARWYTPLLHELRGVEDRIVGGVVLDGPLVEELLASDDLKKFPKALARRLQGYSEAVKKYNAAASKLADFVVAQVRALGVCTDAPPPSGSGRIFTPGSFLRAEDIDTLVKTLVEERDVSATLEVQHATWSRVVCTFSRSLTPATKQEVAKKFRDARVVMSASAEARTFEAVSTAAQDAARSLRAEVQRAAAD